MYLSNESLGVEIVSSKSSEMNVMLPQASGDYVSRYLMYSLIELKILTIYCS